MTRAASPTCRRAFSLMEAMAVVVLVAIAVPPMAAIAQSHAHAAGDAARRHTAVHLAAGVVEAILADVESTDPRLGFAGLARPDYLESPVDGLRLRLGSMLDPAREMSIDFDVVFSDPFTNTGDPAGATEPLAMRVVTVTSTWQAMSGRPASFDLQTAVVNR